MVRGSVPLTAALAILSGDVILGIEVRKENYADNETKV